MVQEKLGPSSPLGDELWDKNGSWETLRSWIQTQESLIWDLTVFLG